MKYLAAIEEELKHFNRCISGILFWHLPGYISKFAGSGKDKLEILINHYSKAKEDTFHKYHITNSKNFNINEDKTRVEWQGFKHFMYLKYDLHRRKSQD